jgi:hypothetical protein
MAWFLAIPVLAIVFHEQQIALPGQDSHRNDLKHLYLGSRLLIEGESPYPYDALVAEASEVRHPHFRALNPYVYPPFTGYFFFWFGKIPYDSAVAVWFWMGHLFLILSMILLWPSLKIFTPLPRLGILLGSVAIFFPLYRSTSAGQLNHFLLFLLSLFLFLWARGLKKSGAAVVALAALVKVQPAILMIYLLWKREWAAFWTGCAVAATLVFLPGLFFGLDPYFEYLEIVKQMGFGSSTWSEQGMSFYVDPGNIAVPALFYRTLAENPVTEAWLHWNGLAYFLSVMWALGILALCLACCRIHRRDEDTEMEIATWIFGMLLIPSLFWDHYLVLALPCFWLLVARLSEEGVSDLALGLAAGCWLLCGVWIVWFNPAYLSGVKILMLNITTPAVVVLFLWCSFLARTSQRQLRHSPDRPRFD